MLPRKKSQVDLGKDLQVILTEFNTQFSNDPFALLSKLPAKEYWRFFIEGIRQDSDIYIKRFFQQIYEIERNRAAQKKNTLFPVDVSISDLLKMALREILERNKDEFPDAKYYLKRLIGNDFQNREDYYLNLTIGELLAHDKGWAPFERREKNYLKGVMGAFFALRCKN